MQNQPLQPSCLASEQHQRRTAAMIPGSIHGHDTATSNAAVAIPMVHRVLAAARLLLRALSTQTHSQPSATIATAIRVTDLWIVPNHAKTAPALVNAMAGMAMGSTQQTPHASAAVAAVAAAAVATLVEPGPLVTATSVLIGMHHSTNHLLPL